MTDLESRFFTLFFSGNEKFLIFFLVFFEFFKKFNISEKVKSDKIRNFHSTPLWLEKYQYGVNYIPKGKFQAIPIDSFAYMENGYLKNLFFH